MNLKIQHSEVYYSKENRTDEASKNLNISGGKTLKKRKGRSRKTKRK